MIKFLGVPWPHLKVLEKLGKVLFSRASSVKYKPLNYVFIRPLTNVNRVVMRVLIVNNYPNSHLSWTLF